MAESGVASHGVPLGPEAIHQPFFVKPSPHVFMLSTVPVMGSAQWIEQPESRVWWSLHSRWGRQTTTQVDRILLWRPSKQGKVMVMVGGGQGSPLSWDDPWAVTWDRWPASPLSSWGFSIQAEEEQVQRPHREDVAGAWEDPVRRPSDHCSASGEVSDRSEVRTRGLCRSSWELEKCRAPRDTDMAQDVTCLNNRWWFEILPPHTLSPLCFSCRDKHGIACNLWL